MTIKIIHTAVIAALASSTSALAGQEKLDLCHVTGNAGIVVINVPMTAANSHIEEHGDFIPNSFYQDSDADGFGDPAVLLKSCEDLVDGFVANASDDNDNFFGLESEYQQYQQYQQYQDATAEEEEFEDEYEDGGEEADEF